MGEVHPQVGLLACVDAPGSGPLKEPNMRGLRLPSAASVDAGGAHGEIVETPAVAEAVPQLKAVTGDRNRREAENGNLGGRAERRSFLHTSATEQCRSAQCRHGLHELQERALRSPPSRSTSRGFEHRLAVPKSVLKGVRC